MTDVQNVPMDSSFEAQEASLPRAERDDAVLDLDDKLHADLSAIYDKIETREKRQAKDNPTLPPLPEGTSMEDTMREALEWSNKPKTERRELAGAVSELEARKAEAKRLGITLEEAEAARLNAAVARISENINTPPEYLETHQAIAQLYPAADMHPAEIAMNYVKWDAALRQDFNGAIAHLAEQTGRSIESVIEGLTARVRPVAQTEQDGIATVKAAQDRLVAKHPEVTHFWNEISEVLTNGEVRQGRDFDRVLEEARERVRQRVGPLKYDKMARELVQTKRNGVPKTLEEEMTEIYERAS
jgi:hypothetical protein